MPGKLVLNEDFSSCLEDIDLSGFDFEKVRNYAEERGLVEKPEFHITIIGRDTGEKIWNLVSGFSKEKREEIFNKVKGLLGSYEWDFSVRPEIYFMSKSYPENLDFEGKSEKRKSIIQLVGLPDLEGFYKNLNELLGTSFGSPYPHVTLFSYSTIEENMSKGIGIYSKEQFWSLDPVKID